MIYEKIIKKERRKIIFDGHFKSSDGLDTIFFKRIVFKGKNNHIKNKGSDSNVHLNIFLVHDILEHHGRYLDLANQLVDILKDKVSICLIDLKGHGLSTGTRHYIQDFREYSSDLVILIRYFKIVNEAKNNRFILVGQGMGALVCLETYLNNKNSVNGLIISNPILKNFVPWFKRINFLTNKIKWPLSVLKVPFYFNGFDLIKEKNSAEDFNSDPLIGHTATLGLILGVSNSIRFIKEKSFLINIPVLIMVSKDSLISDHKMSTSFMKTIDEKYVKFLSYERMKHDILNFYITKNVFNNLTTWISDEFLEGELK